MASGYSRSKVFGKSIPLMEVELSLVLYTNALSNDIIYNLSIYADDTGFCFKCDRVSDY